MSGTENDIIFLDTMAGDKSRIQASHNITTSRTSFPLHTHDQSYEMMLVRSGRILYVINRVAYHLKPGDLTLISPGDFHSLQVEDDSAYERYPVHFGAFIGTKLCSRETDLLSCFQTGQSKIAHLSTAEQEEFIFLHGRLLESLGSSFFGSDLQARSYLTLLLVLANNAYRQASMERRNEMPPLIQHSIRYVDKHLTDNFTVQDVADSLNISRSRLMHSFRNVTGISLWNYVINRRINVAKDLLLAGKNVTSACYESGFRDYSYFIKTFGKNTNGVSPSQYARLNRTDETL